MRILGIETSADETAAAVVENGYKLLSNEVASSLDLHTAYGGIVPEIAARSHLEVIIPVIEATLKTAQTDWDEIDAIAVTQGPGLLGSLLIGVMTARSLAIAKNKPLFKVNHVEAHVYANFIDETPLPDYQLPAQPPQFPLLALIVSGGHTQLALFSGHKKYKLLGQTRDDAIGEAFDKVAQVLGLPYPGGPAIAKAAESGDADFLKLPRPRLPNPYDFSYSGLKTAVLRASQTICGQDYTFPSSGLAKLLKPAQKANIAASFQKTAVAVVVDALIQAAEQYNPASIAIGGGVAANQELRNQLKNRFSTPVILSDIKLCTDNAAMIAANAFYTKQKANKLSLQPEPGLSM